ncbi:MFS transporter [Kitasatospora sp. NPDC059673]|uniref:MFS transporter n=1 Tax=Kitasatospora sp. NPDC059673 TaxID=3346901 RepID=UPI0036880E7D
MTADVAPDVRPARNRRWLSRFRLVGANPMFRRLWIGQFTSELGSSMSVLAIPMLAVAVTGSPGKASILATLGFLTTWLTAAPCGQLADRIPPRRLMLACDTVRLTAVTAVAVTTFAGGPPLWLLAVTTVASGTALTAFGPAAGKMLRTIVPADQLPEAVAANQVRGYSASIVGPAAGGALFGLTRAAPFLGDAVSYLVSLACVRGLPSGAGDSPSARGWPRLREGLAVIRRTPFLRASLAYSVPGNLAVSMLMYILLLRPGAAGGGTGLAFSAAAACGLIGSLFAAGAHRRFGLWRLMAGTAALRLLATLAVGLSAGRLGPAAALAPVLLLAPVVGAALGTTTLLVVDYDVYGRVSGTTSFIGGALQPLAPLAAGALLQFGGTGAALGVVAALFGLVLAAVLAGRRNLDVTVDGKVLAPASRGATPTPVS